MVLSSLSSEAHNIKKVKLNAPPPANLTKPRYIKVLVSVTIGMGDFIHILKAMARFVFRGLISCFINVHFTVKTVLISLII